MIIADDQVSGSDQIGNDFNQNEFSSYWISVIIPFQARLLEHLGKPSSDWVNSISKCARRKSLLKAVLGFW